MARSRKGRSKKQRVVLCPAGPDSLRTWAVRHIEWSRTRNYSDRTLETRTTQLLLFIDWAEARDVSRVFDVTKPILERYVRFLFYYRKRDGRPLSVASRTNRMMAIRALFRWLAKENVIDANPASDLDLPRREHRIPRDVLSVEEVERILAGPDTSGLRGLRDRALLEVLYATAIRRAELVGLDVGDVHHERSVLVIRQGKGKKDRVVPLGERALAWTERYLEEARPELMGPLEKDALFLTTFGERFALAALTNLVREYVHAAGVGKKGACHLFRHTAATLMLENGADIRSVQELLGHTSLNTTQIYTQVSIKRLQAVHRATHPGARLARPSGQGEGSGADPVKSST